MKRSFFIAAILIGFAYFYFDKKTPKDDRSLLEKTPKYQFTENTSQTNNSASTHIDQLRLNLPTIKMDDKKLHPIKNKEERNTASIPKLPNYLRSLKMEEILLAEVEVFEKIDWSQTKETTLDGYQKKMKKIELGSGDIAIKFLEEPMTDLQEIVINEEEGRRLSRSIWSDDGKSKIITYGLDNQNVEGHWISYKDGTLYKTSHDYQDYHYSLEYDANRKISSCIRQKMMRKNSDWTFFGDEEKCE